MRSVGGRCGVRSDSESTFAVETSDGEVLANLTVLNEDRWRVDHLTTCDPSDLDI